MLLSIDPGVSGAYAIIDRDGNPAFTASVPLKPFGKKELIDALYLYNELKQRTIVHSIVENVGVRPGEGISSAGRFMRATGDLEAVAVIVAGSISYVAPAKWKRHFGLIGLAKDESRLLAIRLWPDKAEMFTPRRKTKARPGLTKRECQDRAEAALIGKWYYDTAGASVRRLLESQLLVDNV